MRLINAVTPETNEETEAALPKANELYWQMADILIEPPKIASHEVNHLEVI